MILVERDKDVSLQFVYSGCPKQRNNENVSLASGDRGRIGNRIFRLTVRLKGGWGIYTRGGNHGNEIAFCSTG